MALDEQITPQQEQDNLLRIVERLITVVDKLTQQVKDLEELLKKGA